MFPKIFMLVYSQMIEPLWGCLFAFFETVFCSPKKKGTVKTYLVFERLFFVFFCSYLVFERLFFVFFCSSYS